MRCDYPSPSACCRLYTCANDRFPRHPPPFGSVRSERSQDLRTPVGRWIKSELYRCAMQGSSLTDWLQHFCLAASTRFKLTQRYSQLDARCAVRCFRARPKTNSGAAYQAVDPVALPERVYAFPRSGRATGSAAIIRLRSDRDDEYRSATVLPRVPAPTQSGSRSRRRL
jgi:hypothetical protein